MCLPVAEMSRVDQVTLTARLRLLPVTQEMKVAFSHSREAFERLMSMTIPEGWPEFPQAFAPMQNGDRPQALDPWPGFLFAMRDHQRLIGNGGFVGQPDAEGKVEFGYEIALCHRNHGYATEAADALIRLAFEKGASSVIAHTLDADNASNAVLSKLGFRLAARLPHFTLDTVRRYRIDRSPVFDTHFFTPKLFDEN